ncbi:MAG: SMC family ATPase [Lachnospiraceae bacterium]|nr:SMC family ATPase [Lachnospiraceae bacterium]
MKPLKLTMSAFGSYGKETVIDFTNVDHGLFLITGDTGAGKTTIFDGITFAIYGETSGGKRDGKMMRSQYASPADETFVELTFSYRGEVYTVRRSPEYMREKKRGSGLVKAAATVELTLPDGTAFRGKMKETDKKLCEIMGIDREQFTQIAMIAQGDFLRLLHAKSEDRKKIFSTIFHTGLYRKVEEELWEKRKELKEKIGGTGERMRAHVQGIQVPELVDGLEEIAAAREQLVGIRKEENPDISAVREILELFLTVDLEQLSHLERPLTEVEEQCGRLLEKRGLAKSDNDILESYEKAKLQLVEKSCVEQNYREQKRLLERSERAYQVKGYADRAVQAKKLADTAGRSVEAARRCVEEAKSILENHNGAAFFKEPERYSQQESNSFISEWKADLKNLEALEKKKMELDRQETQLRKAEENCQRKAEQLEKHLIVMAKSREHYGILQERFLCEQAGILAKERLIPGAPCPVCGSIEHPAPAVLPEDAVTELQVKEAQNAWERTRSECERMSLALQGEKSRLEEARAQIERTRLDIPEKLKEKKEAIASAVSAAERFVAERGNFEKKQTEYLHVKENWKLAEQESLAARKEAGFEEEADYLEAISRWKTRSELADQKRENEQYFSELHGIRTAVQTLKEQSEGKEYTNLSALDEELDGWKKKQSELLTKKETVSALKMSHEKLLKTLDAEEKEYSGLLEEFLLYDGLWQAAGGKIKGQVRMDFETYVQRMYFEKILAAANRRFLTFTDGKMKLKNRPVEEMGLVGASGLDLNVYVMATGKERDVKTLSGGESFLASLALALGLSDVVQSQAGSIRLESMFVDEGFGALDDGTRDQAMKVLNDLAGDDRLVGIISHVNALKDGIERKLTVTRGLQGSAVSWN